MAKKRIGPRVNLAPAALDDIRTILRWSEEKFGEPASKRYAALLEQALRDIRADPQRHGSKERPEMMVEGARTYHLPFSRGRVPGLDVKEPRHFLLYRRRSEGAIEVVRVLHDARDLTRHLPKDYRRINTAK